MAGGRRGGRAPGYTSPAGLAEPAPPRGRVDRARSQSRSRVDRARFQSDRARFQFGKILQKSLDIGSVL